MNLLWFHWDWCSYVYCPRTDSSKSLTNYGLEGVWLILRLYRTCSSSWAMFSGLECLFAAHHWEYFEYEVWRIEFSSAAQYENSQSLGTCPRQVKRFHIKNQVCGLEFHLSSYAIYTWVTILQQSSQLIRLKVLLKFVFKKAIMSGLFFVALFAIIAVAAAFSPVRVGRGRM